MRTLLIALFSLVLLTMIAVTTHASVDKGIFEAGRDLIQDGWFRATLVDAYFGFLTFYVWVAYKQRRLASRVAWFVLIMSLGNIAMSIYVLIQLLRLKPDQGMEELLVRRVPDTP